MPSISLAGGHKGFALAMAMQAFGVLAGLGTDYDKSADVGRVAMTMSKPPAAVEQWRITLSSPGAGRGKLDMAWADMAASVNFTVK